MYKTIAGHYRCVFQNVKSCLQSLPLPPFSSLLCSPKGSTSPSLLSQDLPNNSMMKLWVRPSAAAFVLFAFVWLNLLSHQEFHHFFFVRDYQETSRPVFSWSDYSAPSPPWWVIYWIDTICVRRSDLRSKFILPISTVKSSHCDVFYSVPSTWYHVVTFHVSGRMWRETTCTWDHGKITIDILENRWCPQTAN